MKTIPNVKLVTKAPDGEIIVSMIEFKGMIFVATDKNIYELLNKELIKIKDEVI